MKFIKFFLVLVLFSFLILPTLAYAAPTSSAEVPPEIRPTCGYAGIDDAKMCCEPLALAGKLQSAVDVIAELPIPLLGGVISGVFDGLRGLMTKQPLYQQINAKCRLGSPDLDPRTGVEKTPCTCVIIEPTIAPTPTGHARLLELCRQYDNKFEQNGCEKCAKSGGLLTGLGCVPTDYSGFVSGFLLRIGIGLGGLISLGCIIFAAIQIQTSGGDAEKVSKAQEQIKSCLIGLMLVIFSILLLKLIGVSILGIPGFI